MAKVRDDNGFSARVNYAALCFMRGTQSRSFDTCFEMSDGDAVVTALVRRSAKNPKLYEAIARQWREGFPQSWQDTANKYAHISTRDLSSLAKLLRHEAEEDRRKYWAEIEAKRELESA